MTAQDPNGKNGATAQRGHWRTTIFVDGVRTHSTSATGDMQGCVDLALQTWLLGRDRSTLIGKKITAEVVCANCRVSPCYCETDVEATDG